MRLATITGGRDGRLVVLSPDAKRYYTVPDIAGTLQDAVERWVQIEPSLRDVAAAMANDPNMGEPLDLRALAAPLPRAWQWLDGSAFPSHGTLMDRVLGIAPERSEFPLMYQGLSNQFLSGTQDVRLPDEAQGIDFEGEFGVIVDEVPMGISAEAALGHIRLIVQINDWSLRALAGREMKTGFGWVQAKPACSMAPFAVTPDALGDAWRNGRVHLKLRVWREDTLFGEPGGGSMAFGFQDLIAHAARTRTLCAGTVIGSGTVSNEEYRSVGSTCIAERRGIEIIDNGEPGTSFLAFGERVRMEAVTGSGDTPFGAIDQRVVSATLA